MGVTWQADPLFPPTEKQLDYIRSLCEELNYDFDQNEPTTVKEASGLIDQLIYEKANGDTRIQNWRSSR